MTTVEKSPGRNGKDGIRAVGETAIVNHEGLAPIERFQRRLRSVLEDPAIAELCPHERKVAFEMAAKMSHTKWYEAIADERKELEKDRTKSPLQRVDSVLEELESGCFDSSGNLLYSDRHKSLRTGRLRLRHHPKEWKRTVNDDMGRYGKLQEEERSEILEDLIYQNSVDLGFVLLPVLDPEFTQEVIDAFNVGNQGKTVQERLNEEDFSSKVILFDTDEGKLGNYGEIEEVRFGVGYNSRTRKGCHKLDVLIYFDPEAAMKIYESPSLPELAA